MAVKQSDIAAKLGVSRVTVTKALKNSPDISNHMIKLVKKVADEMDYIPNQTARNLTSNKTCTIGIILPDITNMYFSSIVRGMMEVADQKNYHIILTVSKEEKKKEKDNILKLLSMNVDGLLVCQTLDTVEAEIFERVTKHKKPLVFFGRPVGFPGFNYIGYDDFQAAFDLTEFLIKNKKKKIAHISGDIQSDGKYRLDGFLAAMKKHKLSVKKDWIIEGKFFPEFGYEGFNKIFKKGKLPEVIFCGNGMIAQGVYEAIREKNLSIPDDISVVAVDHKKFSEMLYPKLTYIDYPTKELGNEAMNLLIRKIEIPSKRRSVEHKVLKTNLVVNDSLKLS